MDSALALTQGACAAYRPGQMARRRVTTYVCVVRIAEVRDQAAELLARHFAPEEAAGLAVKPAQSLAGALALKRALVQLFREADPRAEVTERDFHLTHDGDGAPRVIGWPGSARAAVAPCAVRVSISHSRTTACGVAAYQEDRDVPDA